jgi:hypothetical protein
MCYFARVHFFVARRFSDHLQRFAAFCGIFGIFRRFPAFCSVFGRFPARWR